MRVVSFSRVAGKVGKIPRGRDSLTPLANLKNYSTIDIFLELSIAKRSTTLWIYLLESNEGFGAS